MVRIFRFLRKDTSSNLVGVTKYFIAMSPDNFKSSRKGLKLGQREFGRRIGISEEEVRKIEKGESKIQRSTQKALEYYLRIVELKNAVNLIESRRFEHSIGLIGFCEQIGASFSEWEQIRKF